MGAASRAEVTHLELDATEAVAGGGLDRPRPGPQAGGLGLSLRGRVLGRHLPIEVLEVWHRERLLARLPVGAASAPPPGDPRPWASRAGFDGFVPLLGLPDAYTLELRAIDAHWQRSPVGRIHGVRGESLPPEADAPRAAPLLLTTYGRTGSTWLTHLLGQHPEVAAWRAFETETVVAESQVDLGVALASEASTRNALGARAMTAGWTLGTTESVLPAHALGDRVEGYAAGPATREAFLFARRRGRALATTLLEDCGRPEARYWVDKCQHVNVLAAASELFPGTRELLCVREPLDTLCSMRAFGEGQEGEGFGRERLPDEASWVRWLGREFDDLGRLWHAADRGVTQLVRYEDLIRDPETTLARVFAHLDLDAGEEVVAGVITRAETSRRERQARHRTRSGRSIGRHHEDLSTGLRELATACFTGYRDTFGYTEEGDAKPLPEEAR